MIKFLKYDIYINRYFWIISILLLIIYKFIFSFLETSMFIKLFKIILLVYFSINQYIYLKNIFSNEENKYISLFPIRKEIKYLSSYIYVCISALIYICLILGISFKNITITLFFSSYIFISLILTIILLYKLKIKSYRFIISILVTNLIFSRIYEIILKVQENYILIIITIVNIIISSYLINRYYEVF